MFVATTSLILPAALEAALPINIDTQEEVLAMSRSTAIVLLVLYICYLFFQLKTHAYLFKPREDLDENIEENLRPNVTIWASASTVSVVTIAIGFCSDNVIDSVDDVVKSSGISKTFYSLILIPFIGNA